VPEPFIRIERDATWINKHENVRGRVAHYYDVWNRWADQTLDPIPWRPGMAGLQRAIRDAKAADASIRAFGGSWSLSHAAYNPQFMVNTKPLAALDIGLRPENLVAGYAHPERLLFAQCGCTVEDVHDALEARGLALATSGASDGQTLAGAISTGTHGAANQVGGMQDTVLGIHLLTENGDPLWIERASRPVVSERFLKLIDTPIANLRRADDDLFDAALVSFGSFGIVHAYLIEAQPLYSLEAYTRQMDFARAKEALATLNVASLDLPGGAALPYHFEIDLNLYRLGRGERGAYVRFMYKRDGGTPAPPAPLPGGHRPGDDVLGIIGTLSDAAPALIPTLVTKLMDGNLPSFEAVRATPGYTFGPTTIRGQGLSTEMGFQLKDAVAAVEIIAGVAALEPFGAVVGVRYVKGSAALAAFTHHPTTCTIEIQAVNSQRSMEAYRRIWSRLDAAGISFTLHWGQVLPYEPVRYRQAYGARLDRWLVQKSKVLSVAGRKQFSNGLVRGVGLE
jgi:hypothetical protein